MIFRRASVSLLAVLLSPYARPADASAPPAAAASPAASAPATSVPGAPLVPTVIESGTAEMVSSATDTTFTFRKGVTVTATNMKLTCDELIVVAKRSGDPAATIGKQEHFKSLVAIGNVRLVQNDREATCGRATVYPGEDKVELTENPVVRSVKEGWTQTGPKMVLYRGERRAVIESTETERPRLLLPPLKDLGDLGQDGRKKKKDAPAPGKSEAAPASSVPPITVPSLPPTK